MCPTKVSIKVFYARVSSKSVVSRVSSKGVLVSSKRVKQERPTRVVSSRSVPQEC